MVTSSNRLRLLYNTTPVEEFDKLLGRFADRDLENLTRSTLPLLSYWRNPERAASAVLAGVFGSHDSHQVPCGALSFEFQVPSFPRITGQPNTPSHTDVMYLSDDIAVAIEAKWSESVSACVAEWLGDGSENKRAVLDHWVRLIRNHTGCGAIAEGKLAKLVYQVLHRTASLCSCASGKSRCAVVYQLFGDGSSTKKYEEALQSMACCVGAGLSRSPLSLWVHEVSMNSSLGYGEVAKLVADVPIDRRPALIKKAILNGSLFLFPSERFIRIDAPKAS